MRHTFLLTLIILSALCSEAQQQQRNFGVVEVFRGGDSIFIKKLVTQVINISDGTVTKMRTPPDTAKLFIAPDGLVYEGVITWRKVGGTTLPPKPDTETIIDNSHAQTIYTKSWTHAKDQPWTAVFQNKTASYSFDKDATISLTFTGKKIEWYTEKRVNHGIAAVSIDNGTEVMVDLYDVRTDNNSQKVFERELVNGSHTIKIRLTGNKNPLASQENIIHDYFKFYSVQ